MSKASGKSSGFPGPLDSIKPSGFSWSTSSAVMLKGTTVILHCLLENSLKIECFKPKSTNTIFFPIPGAG